MKKWTPDPVVCVPEWSSSRLIVKLPWSSGAPSGSLYGRYMTFGCIHRYDLPAPYRDARSEPQVLPVYKGWMDESCLRDESSVDRFARAVVAGVSIAGHRG